MSQIQLSNLKPKSESTVLIEGGKFEVHRDILDWILSCGEAGKTVIFPWFNSPAFADYGMVLLACEELQVNVLQAQVLTRMQDIVALQVHSSDVKRVFSSFSGPHKFKDMICQSIGQAMWDGRLKAMGAYKRLFSMKEYAEFKDGTDAVYGKLEKQWYKTPEGKIAKKEKEESDRKAEEKPAAAKHRQGEKFKRAVAKRHNVEPSKVTRTGRKEHTISTDRRRVRKGHSGRPGFVQVDLRALGVSSRQFRPAEFPALPRKETKGAPAAENARTPGSSESAEDVQHDSKAKDSQSNGKATAVDLSLGMEDMSIGNE